MRVSTQSTFSGILASIRANQYRAVRAQEQLSSGLRILRPSDDPTGTSKALRLRRSLADIARQRGAIELGLTAVNSGASDLQDSSGLLAEARELILQGMNGTLSANDRESIAVEIELLRDQLMDLGNRRVGDRFLFGGTQTGSAPWEELTLGGLTRVVYRGNSESPFVRASDGVDVATGMPGSEVFGKESPTGTVFAGLTGATGGLTADEGSGYGYLVLRHDSTDAGALGTVGVALVAGADDSLLGANALTIDATAGTIQLGNGPVLKLPGVASPEAADFVVENELGGELFLDFTGFTGADYSGTITGNGSASFDGTSFTALSFTETDLTLRDDSDPEMGRVIHIDATAVRRAGEELVTFGGTVNAFDLLQGIAEDLRNGAGLDHPEILGRLEQRLGELDRVHEDVLVGLGVLGSRGKRLYDADDRAGNLQLQLATLLSRTEDADISEVALEVAQSANLLQLAQASGARLIQTTLLNFLG